MAKKISPKIQEATEEFLATLGSSREQLTDEQWRVLATHIKRQPHVKRSRIVLLLFGIIFGSLTVLGFCLTNKRVRLYVPDDTVTIKKAGSKSVISLKPEEIENIIRWYIRFGSSIARSFDFTVFFFVSFGIFWLTEREHNKILRAFISKREPTVSIPNKIS